MTTSYFSRTTISKLVSKKFIAFLFLIVVCTIMLVLNKLSSELFSNIIQVISPIYLGADVVQNSVISHSENSRMLHSLNEKGISIVRNDTKVIKPEISMSKPKTKPVPNHEPKHVDEHVDIKTSMAHIDNNGITVKPDNDTSDMIDISVTKDDDAFDPVKHRMRLFPAKS